MLSLIVRPRTASCRPGGAMSLTPFPQPASSRRWNAHTTRKFGVLLCMLIVIVAGPHVADAQSASASLSPPVAPEPHPAPLVSGPATSDDGTEIQSGQWYCQGYGASSAPWTTATASMRITLDTQVLVSQNFTVNSGGTTSTLSASVPPADYTRRIYCSIDVQDDSSPFASASGGDARDVFPELTPYAAISTDTGNYDYLGSRRRDIWFQIYHSNSTPWDKRGSVTEAWQVLSNPCNLQIQQGVSGAVNTNGQYLDSYYSRITDPTCAMSATQRHTLDTAGYQVIFEQTWRFDNTGVWR
jgi:hypothetical protein